MAKFKAFLNGYGIIYAPNRMNGHGIAMPVTLNGYGNAIPLLGHLNIYIPSLNYADVAN